MGDYEVSRNIFRLLEKQVYMMRRVGYGTVAFLPGSARLFKATPRLF